MFLKGIGSRELDNKADTISYRKHFLYVMLISENSKYCYGAVHVFVKITSEDIEQDKKLFLIFIQNLTRKKLL